MRTSVASGSDPASASIRRAPVRMTSSEPSYVMGYNQVPVVVVVPGAHYVATRPVYMIAPSAKIISIEAD